MKKIYFQFFFLAPFFLFSQEISPLFDHNEENITHVFNPTFVLERDIATSTLEELSDLCRSLGLDGEGNREILEARIRDFFQLETFGQDQNDLHAETDAQIITIESARTTEYFTVESVQENYVRMRGNVSLSIKDGNVLHRIQSEHILYNRTRKLITANGGVLYIREENDSLETFRGEEIVINLHNWTVIFTRGGSDRTLSGEEIIYRFEGEVITQSGENTTVMRRARISNASEEESLWSISASRLWLLPGADWAILNAIIRVGEIPVLYLPGFYYPGNEIIFRPVLGYRPREGTYVQTTSYIFGRPRTIGTTEESSITTILGSGENMERVREGLFLRSIGQKIQSEDEARFSIIADAYTNQGYYAGAELILPPGDIFGELSFSGGLAFSRDISLHYGNYTPFFPNYDGSGNWHNSRIFGANVPFRYRFISAGSVYHQGGIIQNSRVNWNFPFYSDPFIDNHFMSRSEGSDLFSQIKSATSVDFHTDDTFIYNYNWRLGGNLSFITTGLQPYINELSIVSASMGLNFDSRPGIQTPILADNSPAARFFYPGSFTLFSLSGLIRGRPITFDRRTWTSASDELRIPPWGGSPISPWENNGLDSGERALNPLENTGENILTLHPPALTRVYRFPILGAHEFNIDYQITPSAASEMRFNSDRDNNRWERPEDINWADIEYQAYTIRADSNIDFTLTERRNIYSHSLSFFGYFSRQDFNYINESVPDARRDFFSLQSRHMSFYSSFSRYRFTLRPFYQSEIWQNSNFVYTLMGLIASGSHNNNGIWELSRGRWSEETIDIHSVQADLNANIMDQIQNLNIRYHLPPTSSLLSGDATLRLWISETNVHTRVHNVFNTPLFDPVYFSEILSFNHWVSLRQDAVYNPEIPAWVSFNTDFHLGGFSARFHAMRSNEYILRTREDDIHNFGWIQIDGEEKLRPQSLGLRYNKTHFFNEGGKAVFNVTIDSQLLHNLQRYTYSSFYFTLSAGMRINRFLDITLSSHSINPFIFRYFQNIPFFNRNNIHVPGETNFLIDLANSFNFFDRSKREDSAFKIQSFSLDLIHYLGDWDVKLGITLAPKLDQTVIPYRYRFVSDISFLVQWKPIREFRADMSYHTIDGFKFE